MRPILGAVSRLVLPRRALLRANCVTQPVTVLRRFHQFSPRRAMDSANVKWLWPADRESIGFHVGHIHRSRIGVYAIEIKTREPLKEEHVNMAVKHWKRKCPNMRANIRLRGDTYWFCEPYSLEIDSKVVHGGGSMEEELENVRKEGIINENFAPFKLRFFSRGEDVSGGDFRHVYDVVFAAHHGMGDGVSAVMLLQNLLKFLNEVISGNEIDDEEHCRFMHNEEVWELERRIMKRLKEDPDRLHFVKESLSPPGRSLLFLEAFPKPTGIPASTRHAVRVLNERVTANLHKKCKENGVTFNSAFTAAINVAIIRLAKKAGISRKSYRIASSHAVNISRYLKETPLDAVGGYALAYSYPSELDDSACKDFWQYCRVVSQDLREAFRSGLPLEQKVSQLMANTTLSIEEFFKDPPPVVHDFGVTNIGNFSMLDEDHILISNATPYFLLENFVHMNLFLVIIFKGCCSFTLSYATNYVADETASMLVNEIKSVLQEASECANLVKL